MGRQNLKKCLTSSDLKREMSSTWRSFQTSGSDTGKCRNQDLLVCETRQTTPVRLNGNDTDWKDRRFPQSAMYFGSVSLTLQVNIKMHTFAVNPRPRDHVSHVLRDLHWLPIRERIFYKVCLMMFNVDNGTAPTYMTGMVTRISDLSGRCHLRSAAEGLFDVPRTWTVFGSRTFSIAIPVAWNELPVHFRAIRDVIPFKKALKTHFFQLAYPNSH